MGAEGTECGMGQIGMHKHVGRESRVGLELEFGTLRPCGLFILDKVSLGLFMMPECWMVMAPNAAPSEHFACGVSFNLYQNPTREVYHSHFIDGENLRLRERERDCPLGSSK